MASPLKGRAVIGQSGGPTAVINQSLVGAVEECLRHDEAITSVYGARHGIQGILDQDMIDLGRESFSTLERVAATPSSGLGSVRLKPTKEDCNRIFEIFRAHDVRYFFYIGGNDSAETAHIIAELARESDYEFRVAHIPKTIDNDLRVTDHCPGFGSAARFVSLAFRGDDLDNRAIHGVKINIVMGRHAGFLTAAAAIGRRRDDDGPHLVYVPEVPFEIDSFLGDVDAVVKRLGRCVVAVSEGVASADGKPVFTTGELDSHGNIQLSGSGGLGDFLSAQVKVRLGVKRVRADTFGYLQRSFPGEISEVDAREAREVGVRAVRAMVSGEAPSGSIAMRRLQDDDYEIDYFLTELSNVARDTRSVPPEYLNEAGNDVTRAFLDYATPLVGKLPRIGFLEGHPVPKIDI